MFLPWVSMSLSHPLPIVGQAHHVADKRLGLPLLTVKYSCYQVHYRSFYNLFSLQNKPTPFDAFFARLYTKCEIDQTGMFRIQWYSGYDKEQYVFVISQRVKLKLIPLAHVAG